MRRIHISVALALLAAALCAEGAMAAFCDKDSNVTGVENTLPIDLSNPVWVRSVPHGDLYTVGESADDRINLVHLYGSTGYDFGFAAGSLLKDEMNATLTTAFGYFSSQALQAAQGIITKWKIPEALAKLIIEFGLDFVLDWQAEEAKAFMDPSIFDEMRGIADATGLDYQMILRIHMVGEVTRGSCSFYGLFGSATLGGKTLQLRALDWDTGAGLQNHPTVTVYHPTTASGLGVPFANVGWAGWIGVLTGMSSNRLGISEIGISYPDSTFGNESFVGIPFIFLERQIIQRATSVFDAMEMITNANRTCDLVLGVADGNAKTARMVQYSYSVANIMTPENLMPHEPWHPRINDTVYCAMDWICPYYQHIMADQLKAMHGRITPELSISNITSIVRTGSLHVAVYDLTDDMLFVANAKGEQDVSGEKDAYYRQFVRLNMSEAFNKLTARLSLVASITDTQHPLPFNPQF
jgi:isopenicillin-N N-acyltransferase-like protein